MIKIIILQYEWHISLFTSLVLLFSFYIFLVANPIYSIICLILTFISVSLLFLFSGAELMSFLYLLIYVGAVLILFLWVVMLLPIKQESTINWKYFWVLVATGLGLLFLIMFIKQPYFGIIQFSPKYNLFSALCNFLGSRVEFTVILNGSSAHKMHFGQSFLANHILLRETKHMYTFLIFNYANNVWSDWIPLIGNQLVTASSNPLETLLNKVTFFSLVNDLIQSSERPISASFFLNDTNVLFIPKRLVPIDCSIYDLASPLSSLYANLLKLVWIKWSSVDFLTILVSDVGATPHPTPLLAKRLSDLNGYFGSLTGSETSFFLQLANSLYVGNFVLLLIIAYILLVSLVAAIFLLKFNSVYTYDRK